MFKTEIEVDNDFIATAIKQELKARGYALDGKDVTVTFWAGQGTLVGATVYVSGEDK